MPPSTLDYRLKDETKDIEITTVIARFMYCI
jgi:hypothetical protein